MLAKTFALLAFLASIINLAIATPHPMTKALKSRAAKPKTLKPRSASSFSNLNKRSLGDFVAFSTGEFAVSAGDEPFFTINGDILFFFSENDATFYVLDSNEKVLAASPLCEADCITYDCTLYFDETGDLEFLVDEESQCDTGTAGIGALLVFMEEAPYFAVYDENLNVVWEPTD